MSEYRERTSYWPQGEPAKLRTPVLTLCLLLATAAAAGLPSFFEQLCVAVGEPLWR